MCQRSLAERDPEDNLTLVSALPVEILEARDISNAVVWLCSDESAFYTGSAMRIDAGASLREGPGNFLADATAGPGYDGDLVFELHSLGSVSCFGFAARLTPARSAKERRS